jgi:hypothetical protein
MAPKDLMTRMLDEIKLRRPKASVKGTIWSMVGLLLKKFGDDVKQYSTESQD